MVMFRSPVLQSLTSDVFLKKTLKLNNKDIIGAGGYGTVYRLIVNDSLAFAVKKLNRGTADRDKGFERELEAMGDIKHRNIVTLHGYYTAPHYNLLIYELMPNGSLDVFLHDKLVLQGNQWRVKGVVEEKREEYVLDSSLVSCPVDEINNTFNVALMCLETDPSMRPTMAEVVKMLEQIKSEKAVNDF
ncbi:hypothetical protein COLO4_17449 [Corchorus olitorius]|uniref:Protein kinase domain-containing protein n=1 Tax=Corchorus olitorius TaxID=93759 RepID=A0A1R3JCQ1_9ROSI|nr:hypothetical protein COLO4_17449 [Corchorus olitorius]